MFGPLHFKSIERVGVGLGLNPDDLDPAYVERHGIDFDYFELGCVAPHLLRPCAYVEVSSGETVTLRSEANDDYEDLARQGLRTIVHSSTVNILHGEPRDARADERLRTAIATSRTPWVTEDLGVWWMGNRHVYPNFLPLALTRDTLAVAIDNVHRFQRDFGVPLSVENPSVTAMLGDIHLFDFLRVLADETGCAVTLDVGHLLAYQLWRGASPTADFHRLPWASIVELHLSGGSIDLDASGFRYDDTHADAEPVSICWDLLTEASTQAPNLKAVTLEIFGARRPASTLRRVRRLRAHMDSWRGGGVPRLSSPPGQVEGPLPEARARVTSLSETMFDLLHDDTRGLRSLAASHSGALESFATAEQDRWAAERTRRIGVLCQDIGGFLPLTRKWLLVTRFGGTLAVFDRALLAALPKGPLAAHDRITAAFECLVGADPADSIGAHLVAIESWLNRCVSASGAPQSLDTGLDAAALLRHPSPLETLLEGELVRDVTLIHAGGSHFFQRERPSPDDAVVPLVWSRVEL